MSTPMRCSLCEYLFTLETLNECPGVVINHISEVDYGWAVVCPNCSGILISQDTKAFRELNDQEMWALQAKRHWVHFEKYYQQVRSKLLQKKQRKDELLEERKKFKKKKSKDTNEEDHRND